MVGADGGLDVVHIGAHGLGEVGDLVDEADAQGQHGVGGVLGQLGAGRVHAEPLAAAPVQEGLVEGLHDLFGVLGPASDHHAVGLQEVADGGALPEELGVADHLEGPVRPGGDLGMDSGRSAHGHRALVHHHQGGGVLGPEGHGLADLAGHGEHVLHVGAAVLALGGAHADEGGVGGGHACLQVGGEAEGAGGEVPGQELIEARLEDGGLALGERGHLGRVHVHPQDAVASLREAGGGHEADVSRTDDQHLHVSLAQRIQSSLL